MGIIPNSDNPSVRSVNDIVQQHNAGNFSKALEVLDRLPVEAISEGVKTWCETIKINKMMEFKQQDFENKLSLIQKAKTNRNDTMRLLIEILNFPALNDEMRMQLIKSICSIAEGKNG